MLLQLQIVLVMAGGISGIVAVAISACSGESVKLFNIMSYARNYSVVTLYVNDSKFRLIGMWSKGKMETVIETFSLDDNGTVWIRNVTLSDENKYKVLHLKNGASLALQDAQLTVLVAPTNSCRPHVTRDGNTLIASLKVDTDCGKPEAVPYWLEYPDITYNSQTKVILTPGREAGTYNACIETPALSCARSSKPSDFCSSITVYESSLSKPLTDSTVNIVLAVAFGLVGLFAIKVIICRLRRKLKGRLCSKEESHPKTNDDTGMMTYDDLR